MTEAEDAERERVESLRAELRQRFPREAGYQVREATWFQIVDGDRELIPVIVVNGHGVERTFFARRPRRWPDRLVERRRVESHE